MTELVVYDASFADTLAPFVVRFWAVHHNAVALEDARKTIEEWTNDGRLYVIQNDGATAGFLRTHNSSPTVCWIDDIYVDEPYRGRGIASGAIELWEAEQRGQGVRSFCMEVVPDNVPAMRLYHRLGYDRLSLVAMRKDDEPFETERVETVAGLPMRVKRFGG